MMDHYIVKKFYRKDIEKISRSVREYVYLVLTSQVQARSSIVGNSVPAVDSQQAFKGMFKALLNEDYSVGNDTRFFSRHRHIHVSKQFKLTHWKDKGI